MTIENYICYRNPVGKFVEDFVTENQLSKLIKLGIVKPYNYHLQGNFYWFCFDSHVIIKFIYHIY